MSLETSVNSSSQDNTYKENPKGFRAGEFLIMMQPPGLPGNVTGINPVEHSGYPVQMLKNIESYSCSYAEEKENNRLPVRYLKHIRYPQETELHGTTEDVNVKRYQGVWIHMACLRRPTPEEIEGFQLVDEWAAFYVPPEDFSCLDDL